MKEKKYPELTALKGKLREKKETYRVLAEKIEMSVDALNNKLNGYSAFNTDEVNSIVVVLDINPEEIMKYFFPSMLQNAIKNSQKGE